MKEEFKTTIENEAINYLNKHPKKNLIMLMEWGYFVIYNTGE